MHRRHSPGPAFLVALLGIGLFSMMDAVMKGLVLSLGTYAALLWRMAAASLLSGVLFALRPSRPGRAALRIHIIRAALTSVMAVLFFWGLARVPLAQGIALSFVAPLVALYLAATILKEPIGPRLIAASLVALAGVALIFIGQARADLGQHAVLGSLAILASALCYAFNIVLMRQQALVAGPVEVVFFQSLVVGLLLFAAWPLTGGAALPRLDQWPPVMLAAGLGVASLMILSWAYARAEASFLAATEYSAFLWAALFGWLIFAERVSLFTLAGATLIVIGCVLAARSGRGRSVPLEAST